MRKVTVIKRLATCLLAACLCFSLVACGNSGHSRRTIRRATGADSDEASNILEILTELEIELKSIEAVNIGDDSDYMIIAMLSQYEFYELTDAGGALYNMVLDSDDKSVVAVLSSDELLYGDLGEIFDTMFE